MKSKKYGETTATREHLASGRPITQLEATILYGVSNLYDVVSKMRLQGWVIDTQRITYAAALKRVNEYTLLTPPKNLPIREILFTEYWVCT